MSDHAACILAIVGSRDVPIRAAQKLINAVLDAHKPIMVVSGGAKARWTDAKAGLASIDHEAALLARERGVDVTEFVPTVFKWGGPGGFQERNLRIANTCVCLVRIASETTSTYGSGWTADRAAELGKDVERYLVSKTGEIVSG